MEIQQATVVEILPTKVWIESDLLGNRIVVMQHEGCEPFDYATFGYDHRYTSNAGTWAAARELAVRLGATEPVEDRTRALPPPRPGLAEHLAELHARIDALEEDAERMDWLEQHVVNVREPLRHGSRDLFWSGPEQGDGEILPSKLRADIDAERTPKESA